MQNNHDKFIHAILFTNKSILKLLICVLTICLIFATFNLFGVIYFKITSPPFFVLDVTTLFDVFSLVLIIAIGYELIKSLVIIITSNAIPSFPIIQIAIIAVANKIITLDIKHTDVNMLFGLAALIGSLGLTYYFHVIKKAD